MGLFGSSKVELPPVPTFQRNPYTNEIISFGLNSSRSLINQDGTLSPSLQEAISTNPQITQLVLQGLRAQTAGDYRTGRQNIIADLEANNQLTGSTTASALGNYESDYLSGLTAAGAEAGINDINRAMAARIELARLGMSGLGQTGQLALTDQGQENDFNLANYDNIVAKSLAEAEDKKGGIMGGLMGGLGGALAGFALAPFTGGASLLAMAPTILGGLGGAAAGFAGPQGTGGSILNAGAGLKGAAPFDLTSLASPNRIISPNGGPKTESIDNLLNSPSPFGDFSMAGGLRRRG